jgi:molybdopterin synthase catalytic subunit
MKFALTVAPIDPDALVDQLTNHTIGGVVTFTGRVRNFNDGREVSSLEYEVYETLAIREGEKIIAEAQTRYAISDAAVIHRYGHLALGDIAVAVVVVAGHRDGAFTACRYIIDEVKARVPIWKREHFVTGPAIWVDCRGCQAGHHHSHA